LWTSPFREVDLATPAVAFRQVNAGIDKFNRNWRGSDTNIGVVTLRYSETLGGFPEEPLRQILASGNVVGEREYLFTHSGVPHLTLVLVLDGGPNVLSSGEP
jgi:hypothetical protein